MEKELENEEKCDILKGNKKELERKEESRKTKEIKQRERTK